MASAMEHREDQRSGAGAATTDTLAHCYQLLREGYEAERYPSAKVRRDRLRRLWFALDQYADRFCEALNQDFGYRSARQSYFTDIATTGKSIRLARQGVRRWMRDERRHVEWMFALLGARARVVYQPLGVVGVVSPWNVPVNLTLTPLAGVLAAGNRALVKPSEHTPQTSALMAEMLASAFAPDEVGVVNGGVEIGRAFSRLPLDHIIFTGGEGIAKAIMRDAADNLTPLTLELGGKSPVIIGRGADLGLAAKRIVFGKVFNAGQVCLAPDYLLVPRERRDELVDLLRNEIRHSLPGGATDDNYVSVINDRQADRIRRYLSEAEAAGVPALADAGGRAAGNRIPITLLVDPPERLAVCREEIFGPILVIRAYDDFAEAIDYINSKPRPLALYYFGSDRAEQHAVIRDTHSGGVTFNDVVMHYTVDALPFGGIGASGMGAYHGIDGFRRFSHARAVYRQSRFDVARIIRPPYGRLYDGFSRFTMKWG